MTSDIVATFTTRGEAETRRLASALGQVCQGGEVVGLVGDLGAGKTCFVQGLALGLDVPASAYVTSPTFTLVASHRGRVLLHHVDLYRLGEPDEAAEVGYDDLFDGHSVVAVEWFDRFPELWPRGYLRVALSEQSPPTTPVSENAGVPSVDVGASSAAEDVPGRTSPFDSSRLVTVTAVGPGHEEALTRWVQIAPEETR